MHIQHWIRGSTVHAEDTDTAEDWLGIPTPVETCKQHILLLENEPAGARSPGNHFQTGQHASADRKGRDKARARLRAKVGEAAGLWKKASNLELTVRSKNRANEDLRRQIPVGARPLQLLASLYRGNQHSLVPDPPRRPVRRT